VGANGLGIAVGSSTGSRGREYLPSIPPGLEQESQATINREFRQDTAENSQRRIRRGDPVRRSVRLAGGTGLCDEGTRQSSSFPASGYNLQRDGGNAKPYQVKQVRAIVLRYKLGEAR